MSSSWRLTESGISQNNANGAWKLYVSPVHGLALVLQLKLAEAAPLAPETPKSKKNKNKIISVSKLAETARCEFVIDARVPEGARAVIVKGGACFDKSAKLAAQNAPILRFSNLGSDLAIHVELEGVHSKLKALPSDLFDGELKAELSRDLSQSAALVVILSKSPISVVNSQNAKIIRVSDQWGPIIQGFNDEVRVVLAGKKDAGKSTLARFLVNSRLQKPPYSVLYLEADPGQTECNLSGVLALHKIDAPLIGAPNGHLQTPLLQFILGSTTPKNNPISYLKIIRLLVEEARKYNGLPLVVNTCGWLQGRGIDILHSIVDITGAKDVISIIDTQSNPNYEFPAQIRHHKVASMNAGSSSGGINNVSAAQARLLVWKSYLNSANSYWLDIKKVNIGRPVCQSAQNQSYSIKARGLESVSPEMRLAALNATVIGLSSSNKFQNIDLILFPVISTAIVRAVDLNSQRILVQAPLSLADLMQIDTILASPLEIPHELLLNTSDLSINNDNAGLTSVFDDILRPYQCRNVLSQFTGQVRAYVERGRK